jgi:hypothetical protein
MITTILVKLCVLGFVTVTLFGAVIISIDNPFEKMNMTIGDILTGLFLLIGFFVGGAALILSAIGLYISLIWELVTRFL